MHAYLYDPPHAYEHAYARMERDTQAQHRRGAPPVVSLGEVPGVTLSGLLGPSFRAPTKPIESTILPLLSFRSASHFLARCVVASPRCGTLSNYIFVASRFKFLESQTLEISLWFRLYNRIYCCKLLLRVDFFFAHFFTLIIFAFRWIVIRQDSNVICTTQFNYFIILYTHFSLIITIFKTIISKIDKSFCTEIS